MFHLLIDFVFMFGKSVPDDVQDVQPEEVIINLVLIFKSGRGVDLLSTHH